MLKRFFTDRLRGLEEQARPGSAGRSPDLVVQVKAWRANCRRPTVCRYLAGDAMIWRVKVCQTGLVASVSGSTLWRWLHQDAIRP